MDEHDGLKKTGLKATLPRLKIMDIFEHPDSPVFKSTNYRLRMDKSTEAKHFEIPVSSRTHNEIALEVIFNIDKCQRGYGFKDIGDGDFLANGVDFDSDAAILTGIHESDVFNFRFRIIDCVRVQ